METVESLLSFLKHLSPFLTPVIPTLIALFIWNCFVIRRLRDKETFRLIIVQLDVMLQAYTNPGMCAKPKREATLEAWARINDLRSTLTNRRQTKEFRDKLARFARDPLAEVVARATALKEEGLRLIGERGKASEDNRA